MDESFFERPILNSPYAYPARHWELDAQGQPTGQTVETRRTAQFITPIPRPKKRRGPTGQQRLVFDEGAGVSTAQQEYDPNPIIKALRLRVDQWRGLKNPGAWGVTPETARLLQHWRHHEFTGALDDDFRGMAADEIDRFRREIVERTGDRRAGRARPTRSCSARS